MLVYSRRSMHCPLRWLQLVSGLQMLYGQTHSMLAIPSVDTYSLLFSFFSYVFSFPLWDNDDGRITGATLSNQECYHQPIRNGGQKCPGQAEILTCRFWCKPQSPTPDTPGSAFMAPPRNQWPNPKMMYFMIMLWECGDGSDPIIYHCMTGTRKKRLHAWAIPLQPWNR